jgi:hypothetical protein
MYSLVSICKKCQRRVLGVQLSTALPEGCIYCYVDHLVVELRKAERKSQDQMFALALLDTAYTEATEAYRSTICEIERLGKEIGMLREESEVLRARVHFANSKKDLLG